LGYSETTSTNRKTKPRRTISRHSNMSGVLMAEVGHGCLVREIEMDREEVGARISIVNMRPALRRVGKERSRHCGDCREESDCEEEAQSNADGRVGVLTQQPNHNNMDGQGRLMSTRKTMSKALWS